MSHKDYAVVMRHQKKKCILVNQSGDMPAQSQKRQGKTTGNHFKFKLNCGYYTHTHTPKTYNPTEHSILSDNENL